MARTLEQKIATLDAKIARLRHKNRQLETGQKIIIGGILLKAAYKDQRIRDWLIKEFHNSVKRDADKIRLEPLIKELMTFKN